MCCFAIEHRKTMPRGDTPRLYSLSRVRDDSFAMEEPLADIEFLLEEDEYVARIQSENLIHRIRTDDAKIAHRIAARDEGLRDL